MVSAVVAGSAADFGGGKANTHFWGMDEIDDEYID